MISSFIYGRLNLRTDYFEVYHFCVQALIHDSTHQRLLKGINYPRPECWITLVLTIVQRIVQNQTQEFWRHSQPQPEVLELLALIIPQAPTPAINCGSLPVN